MNVRATHALLLLSLLGTAHAADVYRSTAPDGTVSYSDRPQGADAEFIVSTTPRARVPVPAAAATRGASPRGAPAELPQAAAAPAALPEGPSGQELREQRQKNCEVARERLDRYTLSRRLFRTNDAGQREYLDDAAVAEARAKAAADVEDWCA
jgi:hypothetical protein